MHNVFVHYLIYHLLYIHILQYVYICLKKIINLKNMYIKEMVYHILQYVYAFKYVSCGAFLQCIRVPHAHFF